MTLFLILSLLPIQASDFQLNGYLSLKGLAGEGDLTYLGGGTNKLPLGDDEDGLARLHASLTWEPSLYFKAHVHGAARTEPDAYIGDEAGLVEAWIQTNLFFGEGNRIGVKAGLFFPPNSLENPEPLWVSPYTLTLSSLNHWIGEEVRWTGIDVVYDREFGDENVFFIGGTAYMGNDAAGALLAWRGWAPGERLTFFDEVVALPDLVALSPVGAFYPQRPEGVKPLDEDLDDRIGWAARLGFELGPNFLAQAQYSDNRADRGLYVDEYAWHTRFLRAGFVYEPDSGWAFLAEFLDGDTGMGDFGGPHSQIDMQTYYATVSKVFGQWRLSLRGESFETEDVDVRTVPINANPNDEDGESYTLALFWSPGDDWRFGVEYLHLDAERRFELVDGIRDLQDGDLITLDLRYQF